MFNNKVSEKLDGIAEGFFSPSSRSKRYFEHPLKSLNIFFRTRLHKAFAFPKIEITARTFWGDPMRVFLPEGAPVYLWGFVDGEELNLTKFLLRNVKPGDVFIDVGAHFGFYTLLASRLIGEKGSIHSFEPTPRTFSLLKRNTQEKKNIFINQSAVFRKSGESEFIDFGPGSAAFNSLKKDIPYVREATRMEKIAVRTITLDEYVSRQAIAPTFIKIDVEGGELDVLNGAKKILSQKPVLSVEIWNESELDGTAQTIRDFLSRYGYIPYRCLRGELAPFEPEMKRSFSNVIFIAEK